MPVKKFSSFVKIFNRNIPSIFGSISDRKDAAESERRRGILPIIYGSIGRRKDSLNNDLFLHKEKLKEWYDHAIPHSDFANKPDNERKEETLIPTDYYEEASKNAHKALTDHYHKTKEQLEEKKNSKNLIAYSQSSADLNRALIRMHQEGLDPHNEEHHKKIGSDLWTPRNNGQFIDPHEYVKNLDADMDKFSKPAPEDFHVYTGIGDKIDLLSLRNQGHEKVHMPAFTSTSVSPETAHIFSRGADKWENGDIKKYKEIVRIKVPKGSTHGTYLGDASAMHSEREFLIKRGKNLKFIGEPRVISKHENDAYRRSHSHFVVIHDAEIEHPEEENKQ